MKFRVVNTKEGLWGRMGTLTAKSFESALRWCVRNGYDIVEQL